MKVQTKLIVLMVSLAAFFSAVFAVYIINERAKLVFLAKEETKEKNLLFDKIVSLKEASLRTFDYDYSLWDEMVNFVSSEDPKWAKDNINVGISTYQANAAFVYNAQFKLIYSFNNIKPEISLSLPFSQNEIFLLFSGGNHSCKFFIITPIGVMEIHGSTINPSNDDERKTPAKGYLFTGRVWSESFIKEIEDLTSSKIVLSGLDKERSLNIEEYPELSAVYFSRIFTDWQEQPLKRLDGIFELKTIQEFYKVNKQEVIIFIFLCFLGLAVSVVSFNFLVRIPLLDISRTLETEDSAFLKGVEKTRDEFGAIAGLIQKFFQQRDDLVKEVHMRELAEDSMKEYGSLLGATLESTMDGILVVDLHNVVESYNQKFFNLWGFPPDLAECKDEKILLEFALTKVEDSAGFKERIEFLYSQPDIESYDIVKFRDGRIIELFSQPQRLGKEIVGRVWSFRDVTERKQSEDAIRNLKTAFEQSIDGIVILDLGGFVKFVNGSWALMHGYKVSELQGKHFSLFHSRQQMDGEVIPFNSQVLKEGSNEGEIGHIHRNGVTFQTWMTTSLLKDSNGKPIGLVGTARDISERKRSELQLESAFNELKKAQTQLIQSAKMAAVGQLGSGIAHEINNPLTGVLNNVQLIKMLMKENKDCKAEEFKELLDVIEESAHRCIKITRALLDFSHASKGVFQPLQVNEVVEKVVNFIGNELKLDNIRIEKALAADLPQVSGDSQLLQQAIFDIVNNARWAVNKKASPREGVITLRTENDPAKRSVIIYILDTGVGISKENLGKIFDPFFTTKKVGEGTGLGMAIVSNIMDKHNGTIEVTSEVGVGTTFKLILPAILGKES
jgi:PAS domain S-box-containing protein